MGKVGPDRARDGDEEHVEPGVLGGADGEREREYAPRNAPPADGDDGRGDVARELEAETEGLEIEKEEIEARVSSRYREYRALFMLALQRWFRDLLVLRAGGEESTLNYPEYAETLRARARNLTLAQALGNIAYTEDIARQAERALPEATVLSYWLDRMALGLQ